MGRKNEFDTAEIERFKYDFPMSFFAYLQSLFNFEEVFLFQDLMLQCYVFSVEQCQQSELIPSGVNQASLNEIFRCW